MAYAINLLLSATLTQALSIFAINLLKVFTGCYIFVYVFAVLWVPQIIKFEMLWTYRQSVLAYITPPIVICFILGIL